MSYEEHRDYLLTKIEDNKQIKLQHLSDLERERQISKRRVSGVYFMVRDGTIVYIGQSVNLNERLSQGHHCGFGADIFCIKVKQESLDEVEQHFIRKYNPPFNGNKYDKKVRFITEDELDKLVSDVTNQNSDIKVKKQ